MGFRFLTLPILIFLILGSGNQTNGQLTRSDKELFQWFDGLEFPDFAHLPLIRVETPANIQIVGEKIEKEIAFGFLIEDSKKEFSFWNLELEKEAFAKLPADDENRTTFERFSIETAAADLVRKFGDDADGDGTKVHIARFGKTISQSSELFLLARGCFQQNKNQAASALLRTAHTLVNRYRDKRLDEISLKQSLSSDFAQTLLSRVYFKIDDPKVPFAEVEKDLLRIQNHFPKFAHRDRVVELRDIVLKMIEEKKKHTPIRDWQKLSTDRKVSELIYLLRNVNGGNSYSEFCDIFGDSREMLSGSKINNPNAAKKLADIGVEAVPQLIAALGDKRLTRSVEFDYGFRTSEQTVIRVGDCAQKIIQRISAYGVDAPRYADKTNPDDTKFSDRARRWLDEYNRKGEKQLLIELTLNGDYGSASQASRLAEKYPDVAFPIVKKAFLNARSDFGAYQLLNILTDMGKKAVPFLEEQLAAAKTSRHRVRFATRLHRWNPDLAVITLSREFDKAMLQSEKIADLSNIFHPKSDPVEEHYDLVEYLIDSMVEMNDAKMAQYLVNHFDQWPMGIRMKVIEKIGSEIDYRWKSDEDPESVKTYRNRLTGDVKEKYESLLIQMLSDPVRFRESPRSPSTFAYSSNRMCDYALKLLSRCLPKEYSYKETGSEFKKELQRISAINYFRKKKNLSALTLPAQPQPNPAVTQRAHDHIQKLVRTENAEERKSLAQQYRIKFGEDGLAAAFEKLDSLAKTHPTFSDLNTMSKNISNTVVSARNVGVDSLDTEFGLAIKKLKGRRLNSEMIKAIFSDYIRQPPQGSTGFYFSARKGERNHGIRIEYALTKTWSPKRGVDPFYDLDYAIRIEGKSIQEKSGNRNVRFAVDSDMYDKFLEAAHEALEESAQKTFAIDFIMRRSK